jgi:DNA-binding transcriptional LysR family regulator
MRAYKLPYTTMDLTLLRTFALVVETGSVTTAADRLNISQPAVSQQLHRLEERLGKVVFEPQLRGKKLTADGELLLGYATTMLNLNDQALARFQSPSVSGRIVLGTPDLYASFFLPQILSDFGRTYPTVQIDLRCALSRPLLDAFSRDELDLVLATQMPGNAEGHFVRTEPLFFVTADGSTAQKKSPLPLAMLPKGNLYRDYALNALEAHGRPWYIACESESIAGLLAAVRAGLAVTVLTQPAVEPGLRICSGFDGVPNLPSVDLVLYFNETKSDSPANRLAEFLFKRLT